MKIEDFLIGAGLGTIVGGLFGAAMLPLGWYTILFLLCSVTGWYVYYSTSREKRRRLGLAK